jgi:hypothetical protein
MYGDNDLADKLYKLIVSFNQCIWEQIGTSENRLRFWCKNVLNV